MDSPQWLSLVQKHRAIGVIRAPNFSIGQNLAHAISGSLKLIEITWDSESPTKLIQQLSADLPDCVIGTGTIFSVADLKAAIAAGAQYVFTPHTDFDLIAIARRAEIPIVCGALTPTEIITAWRAGASSVKVFPVQSVGGASYIQNLRSPLAHVPMIPTGGVTIQNAKEFIQAGAIGVGISSGLFPKAAIDAQNWNGIQQQAQVLMQSLTSVP